MKIQYISDMHLELSDNSKYFKNNYPKVTGDILIIAGDTMYFCNEPVLKDFWKHCHENYKMTILIPGNHEYYHYFNYTDNEKSFKIDLGYDNVFYAQNVVINIDDIDIICSTLWSNIPIDDYFYVRRRLNDFHQILYNDHIMNPDDYNNEHQYCLNFIKDAVEKSNNKKIVVTHHLPSYKLIHERYKGDILNSCFATELFDYIYDSNIDVWIYGHDHSNKDITIGNTFVTSNQFGYARYNENNKNGYEDGKYVEIN